MLAERGTRCVLANVQFAKSVRRTGSSALSTIIAPVLVELTKSHVTWSSNTAIKRLHTSSTPRSSTTFTPGPGATSTDSRSNESDQSHDSSTSGNRRTDANSSKKNKSRRIGLISSSLVLTTLLLSTSYQHLIDSSSSNTLDSIDTLNDPLDLLDPSQLHASTSHLRQSTLVHLLRQYVVYLGSEQAKLVEAGPWLLSQLERCRDNVPIIGPLVWSVFKFSMEHTFYRVFVGGETVADCRPLIEDYLNKGIGIALNYSAEASLDGSSKITGVNEAHISEAVKACKDASFVPSHHLEQVIDEATSSPCSITATPSDKICPTLLAIKLTGLVFDSSLLARASSAIEENPQSRDAFIPSELMIEQRVSPFPTSTSLSEEDHLELGKLYQGLRKISSTARENGIRLLIDAEQSWYQTAINHLATLLILEFNTAQTCTSDDGPSMPIIYNTYQCYLRSTPERMKNDLELTRKYNLSFGAKLVRGAYVESERKLHARKFAEGLTKDECCVWGSKKETDECYDLCSSILVDRLVQDLQEVKKGDVPGVGVFTATHNGTSVKKILAKLRQSGLIKFDQEGGATIDDRLRGRISFAQLMGMSDNLTNAISRVLSPSGLEPSTSSQGLPLINKWVPYASVDQALPYLIRRANENQSILKSDPTSGRGGAREERRAIGKEIRRRFGLSWS